jgi:hypothetical protein
MRNDTLLDNYKACPFYLLRDPRARDDPHVEPMIHSNRDNATVNSTPSRTGLTLSKKIKPAASLDPIHCSAFPFQSQMCQPASNMLQLPILSLLCPPQHALVFLQSDFSS